MSVNSKMTAIADNIRDKTGGTDLLTLDDMAEGVNEVYEAGKASMIDESKVIEKTVSGKIISVDDVSEIPHEVGIQLSSDTVTDFSGVTVTRIGKNLLDKEKWIAELKKTDEAGATTYTAIIDGYECIAIHPAGHTVETGKYMLGEFKENTQYVFSFIGKADISNYTGLVIKYTDGSNELLRLAQTTWTKYSCVSSINKTIKCFGMYFYSGTYGYYADFQIEVGVAATSYEPYIEAKEFTPNADGTVEGITSISPNMTVFTDNADVDITMDYHRSYGMWLEWNRRWDGLQNYGNLTDYRFFYAAMNMHNIRDEPKYKVIKPTSLYMFSYLSTRYTSEGIDFASLCEQWGVTFDTSNCTEWGYAFSNAAIARVPPLDARGKDWATQVFYFNSRLHTVDEILVDENTKLSSTYTFNGTSNLENIKFTGTIAMSVSFAHSTKLSKASFINIFGCFSTTATFTVTFSRTAVINAFGSVDATEWTTLVASRPNVTVSLV